MENTNFCEDNLEALKFLTNRYVDNIWKHSSISLIALGWVLSSSQIQLLLKNKIYIQLMLSLVFVVLQSIHWFVNKPIFNKIRIFEKSIAEQKGKNIAEAFTVKYYRFVLNEIMLLLYCIVALLFIWMYPII